MNNITLYSLLPQDEIAEDVAAQGVMFVPVISGSDKTTVSVATGHQEYHPVYMSPGNITNPARRAHGNGVLPVAFLPIPKSKYFSFIVLTSADTASESSQQRAAKNTRVSAVC